MINTTDETKEIPMEPPRKHFRRGSQELEDALKMGEVKLSLPQPELNMWLGRSNSCETPTDSPTVSICPDICNSKKEERFKNEANKTAEKSSDNGEERPVLNRSYSSSNSVPQTSIKQPRSSRRNTDTAIKDQSQEKNFKQEKVSTKFSDIVGHGAVKLRLDEVLLPLALPKSLADSILTGIRALSPSILLFGPPGCGKTQLAKAIAGEAQAAYIPIGPSDVLSKFVGESEASIKSLFASAYEQAQLVESKCSVLFFDEIDALGQTRGGVNNTSRHSEQNDAGDPCSRRVLAELLIQLNKVNGCVNGGSIAIGDPLPETDYNQNDSYQDSPEQSGDLYPQARIIVVAATNRPEDCDPALVRRFSVRVMVGLPSLRDRKKILRRYLEGVENNLGANDVRAIAEMTDGWSGSDLESLTREATMAPVRECIRSAARLKRRLPRKRQHEGDSPCQSYCHSGATFDPGQDARSSLLLQFRNLRPVTISDFNEAIEFWGGSHAHETHNLPYERSGPSGRPEHYDSSSESSSDEDD